MQEDQDQFAFLLEGVSLQSAIYFPSHPTCQINHQELFTFIMSSNHPQVALHKTLKWNLLVFEQKGRIIQSFYNLPDSPVCKIIVISTRQSDLGGKQFVSLICYSISHKNCHCLKLALYLSYPMNSRLRRRIMLWQGTHYSVQFNQLVTQYGTIPHTHVHKVCNLPQMTMGLPKGYLLSSPSWSNKGWVFF